jgi:hypothetical protein
MTNFNHISQDLINDAIAIANNSTTALVKLPQLEKLNYGASFQSIPYINKVTGKAEVLPSDQGKFVTRDDTGKVLGIVKSRYGIVHNNDIHNQLCEAIEDVMPRDAFNGNIELREVSSYGGALAEWSLSFDGMARDIQQLTGSTTQLNFLASACNSFGGQGQSSVKVQIGSLDLICTNKMVSANLNASAWGHTLGFDVKVLREFIEQEIKIYDAKVKVWRAWAKKSITSRQAEALLNEAYPPSASEIAKAEKKGLTKGQATSRKMRLLMEQFEVEAETRGATVWAIYSALTNYSSHSSTRFTVKNSKTKDNVLATLQARETEIAQVVQSDAFQELATV